MPLIAVVATGQQEPQQAELTPDDRAFVRRSAYGALVLLGVFIGAPVAIAAALPAFIHGRMDPNGVYHIELLPNARMALRIHDLRTGEAVSPPRRSES